MTSPVHRTAVYERLLREQVLPFERADHACGGEGRPSHWDDLLSPCWERFRQRQARAGAAAATSSIPRSSACRCCACTGVVVHLRETSAVNVPGARPWASGLGRAHRIGSVGRRATSLWSTVPRRPVTAAVADQGGEGPVHRAARGGRGV